MACAQSSSRSSTSCEQRYSSGRRSNASSSAVVPSSRAASSYAARACPISFWAIDEKATSSSSMGAIPVHSESRHPTISSSSAISSNECASCSFTSPPQLLLQRVAVDPVVVAVELVGEVLDLDDRFARNDPQCFRLAAPAVELLGIRLGEVVVRSLERAGVVERLPLALLAEDLVDHVKRLLRGRRHAPTPSSRAPACGGRAGPATSARGR